LESFCLDTSRRIRPIVSTISIPHRPIRAKAGSQANRKLGGELTAIGKGEDAGEDVRARLLLRAALEEGKN
jgi:hypothetical protein